MPPRWLTGRPLLDQAQLRQRIDQEPDLQAGMGLQQVAQSGQIGGTEHLGGNDGAPHDYTLLAPNAVPRPLKSKEIDVPVPSGSVIHVLSGGGGGWGNPADRDPRARDLDAAEGLT